MTAIDVRNNSTVGCCFYVAREEKMYVSGDMKLGGLQIVEKCKYMSMIKRLPSLTGGKVKQYAQPTVVLAPTRINDDVEMFLNPTKVSDGPSEQATVFQDAHVYESRPAHEFAYDSSRTKLEDLLHSIEELHRNSVDAMSHMSFVAPGDEDADQGSIASLDPGLSARKGRTLRLSAMVDLDSKVSVGCAGAVLNYLQRRKAGQCLPREGHTATAFQISTIEFFSLKDVM